MRLVRTRICRAGGNGPLKPVVVESPKKCLYCIVLYNLYIAQFLSHLKPRPKPRLTASKILSPGRGPFKLLSRLSTAYSYPISAQLGLWLQAEPLTSLKAPSSPQNQSSNSPP